MITKEELLSEYERVTNNILDECDWKTHFTSIEVCTIVYNILRRHDIELSVSLEEFHRLYMLRITTYWSKKFTQNDAIDTLYELIIIILNSDPEE